MESPVRPLREPYPEVAPFDTRMMAVGDGHTLHVEQVGNPQGEAAVFLHGGPGSGCQPMHRQLFDPARFRAVLLDQRGAGRSTPKGERGANTTQHLVADLEHIRRHLGIERWLVVGGSWGATLAVAYAETHPQRVAGVALRGVFLGTRREWRWAFVEAPRIFRPELYAALLNLLPAEEHGDVMAALGRRLRDPDPSVYVPAAVAWGDYERTLSEIRPEHAVPLPASFAQANTARAIPATPYIEAHYYENDCFLRDGQLLAEAPRLAGIPAILVQGRYDLLCPPATSFALARAWPGCELRLIETAGHALPEPGIRPALIQAIEDVADRAR
jgi:proline iminopeptidase